MSIRKAVAAMDNLITSAHYMLLHSKRICKAVKDTGQVSAPPIIQATSRYIPCHERRELGSGRGEVVEGREVKGSRRHCTGSARHFGKMKGHPGLSAVVVSFHLFVPWWSS